MCPLTCMPQSAHRPALLRCYFWDTMHVFYQILIGTLVRVSSFLHSRAWNSASAYCVHRIGPYMCTVNTHTSRLKRRNYKLQGVCLSMQLRTLNSRVSTPTVSVDALSLSDKAPPRGTHAKRENGEAYRAAISII